MLTDTTIDEINEFATPLTGDERDYQPLLEMAANRQFVLLGEASHGTHEFYRMRADITRRLIAEHDFDAVVIEGDWPDVYRANRYVCSESDDVDAEAALGAFDRFPRWMWRNHEMTDFVEWLRGHNESAGRFARLYGLDLYSLHRSAGAVIEYLESVDPPAAARARERYACLDPCLDPSQDHSSDPQGYGLSASLGTRKSCEDEVVAQLQEMLRSRLTLQEAGPLENDRHFIAEINARLVRNAEAYYRGMFSSRVNTWNLRDGHMAEVLFALHEHLSRRLGRPARLVVWAHNSHLGDARATQVSTYGELNLGQLVREKAARQSLLVGFTTYTGHVTAARDWNGAAEHRWVRPAIADSVERLFGHAEPDSLFLPLRGGPKIEALQEPLLERAIGVIYRPETERQSHYFRTRLAEQFDAVFHLDETTALKPLDIADVWNHPEPPATWPSGQ